MDTKIIWSDQKPLDSISTFRLLEEKLNICLPNEVKTFLKEHNGGCSDKLFFHDFFYNEYWFSNILNFELKTDDSDILDLFELLSNNDGTYRFLPFGEDQAGNILCLDCWKASFPVMLYDLTQDEFLYIDKDIETFFLSLN